jgi:hypothetical protein
MPTHPFMNSTVYQKDILHNSQKRNTYQKTFQSHSVEEFIVTYITKNTPKTLFCTFIQKSYKFSTK